MLALPSSVGILLSAGPVDMRNSIDGLMAIVKNNWKENVFAGHLFAFVSKKGDKVKILTWERGGFVLYYKRLEQGRVRLPEVQEEALGIQLDPTQLAMLLDGIDYSRVRRPKKWEPPDAGLANRSLIYPSRWQRSQKTISARGGKKQKDSKKKSVISKVSFKASPKPPKTPPPSYRRSNPNSLFYSATFSESAPRKCRPSLKSSVEKGG
jgi:transposase